LPTIRKKLRNLILTFSFLFALSGFCQNTGVKTDSISVIKHNKYSVSKIDSILNLELFKKSDFNKVGYTRINCVGYGTSGIAYLFWSDKSKTFVQKFEYLDNYKSSLKKYYPILIKDSVFFNFYKNNNEKLKNESVLRFKYDSQKTNPKTVSTGYISRAHSCHRKFKIKTTVSEFSKEFDLFDIEEFDSKKNLASNRTKEEMEKWKERNWELESDSIYENHPKKNINFGVNNNLTIVEWDKIISDFITELESENKFELIKTE